MTKYVFADNKPLRIKNAKKADPQIIGETLAQLTKDAGGDLKANKVVAAAQDESHPLHKHFEWDNVKAGHAYRLGQANELIRIVREDHTDFVNPVRSFVSINSGDGTSYRTVQQIRESVDLQGLVLKQAESDLAAWENRYQELLDICLLVRVAREKLIEKRENHESSRLKKMVNPENRPQ